MGPLLIVLGVLFTILKLTGAIAWSWWIVLSPFIAFGALAVIIVMFFGGFVYTAGRIMSPGRNRRIW